MALCKSPQHEPVSQDWNISRHPLFMKLKKVDISCLSAQQPFMEMQRCIIVCFIQPDGPFCGRTEDFFFFLFNLFDLNNLSLIYPDSTDQVDALG